MTVIDRGSGVPLVLVPGIQGRWEYLRPAVDALAGSCRVLTFSLCGERASGHCLGEESGIDADVDQIRKVLDDLGVDRAVICGVSFGGLIALRFAATCPGRTAALILASTPGPDFHLRPRHELYTRVPIIFGPVFLAETPWRLRPEIKAALPRWRDRLRFSAWQIGTLLSSPLSVTRMARRAGFIAATDRTADARRVTAPTLIVTGEPDLDRVVATAGSSKYAELIPNARRMVIDGTGHIGSITKPRLFAAIVSDFLRAEVQRPGAFARGRAS